MKIISVISQKGGVGKSTITFNLACNLKDSAKVCIIDTDYQGSLMNIENISQVEIYDKSKMDEIIKSDNYDFVFIDTPPYLSENLIEICKMSDVIIIPTKAGVLDLLAITSTMNVIESAKAEDKTIIVFNMVKPNTTLTQEIKNQLQELSVPVAKTSISDLVSFSRSVAYNGVEDNNKAQRQIDNLTKEILTLSIK